MVKKAKDVLRAAGLPLLDASNVHVKEDVRKVRKGKKLSPVLLVEDGRLIIADGYHRVCAIYELSEDLEIPCRLVHA
jgi:disulfide oxidoreductase YuzD